MAHPICIMGQALCVHVCACLCTPVCTMYVTGGVCLCVCCVCCGGTLPPSWNRRCFSPFLSLHSTPFLITSRPHTGTTCRDHASCYMMEPEESPPGRRRDKGCGVRQRLDWPLWSLTGPYFPHRGLFLLKAQLQRKGPAGLVYAKLRLVALELVPSRGAARAPHERPNVGESLRGKPGATRQGWKSGEPELRNAAPPSSPARLPQVTVGGGTWAALL